jgi:hypothetical protein
MVVDKPLKLIGDENNPSNVILEMSGTIIWRSNGGFIEGLTFRRPQISSDKVLEHDLLLVETDGKLKLNNIVLDNEGSYGNVVSIHGPGYKGHWEYVSMQNGIIGIALKQGAIIELSQVKFLIQSLTQ